MHNIAIVSKKGWVVIPKALRERHGLKPGIRVAFVEYGGVISLVPLPEDPIDAFHGFLKGGPPLTQELLEEHRREREREAIKERHQEGTG